MPTRRLLTDQGIREIINSPDLLVLTIRAHQAVDAALVHLLELALAEPHHLELARLSFMLKVDLAVAMGSLPSRMRRGFEAANRIRNRFAHDAEAALLSDDRGLLLNSLDPDLRESLAATSYVPDDVDELLRTILFLCLAETQNSIHRIRSQHATNAVAREMVRERIGRPGIDRPESPGALRLRDEMEARIAKKLEGDSQ